MSLKADFWACSQHHELSLERRSLRGFPKNQRRSGTSFGSRNFRIAATFSLSGWMPAAERVCPRKLTWGQLNLHFSPFRVRFASLSRCSTAVSRSSCSCCVFPWIRMSSTRHTTPSIPFSSSAIRRWKCSGAELMPNGSLLNRYRSNGAMSREDSLARGICQNPELASNLENIQVPAIWARICSTAGGVMLSTYTIV